MKQVDYNSIVSDMQENREKTNILINKYIKNNKKDMSEDLCGLFKEILPYTDISLHFSLKNTSIEDVKKTFYNYMIKNSMLYDVSTTTIHHCFMRRKYVVEKGFSTELVDWLDKIVDNGSPMLSYLDRLENIKESRETMMVEMEKSFKPICIFVGDIIDGVEEEYEMAKDLGIPTLEL